MTETNQALWEENHLLKQKRHQLEQSALEIQATACKLQREHEWYQDMLKFLPSGIYRARAFPLKQFPEDAWMDLEKPPYILELVNDRFCEILGISRETFKTKPHIVYELVHPDDKEDFIRCNEKSHIQLIPFLWEGRLVIAGEIRWVHFESRPGPVANDNGDVVFTGILLDITDRKKKEEELKELISRLNKAKEEIKTLKGIVPICSHCKMIRDDRGFWDHVEVYVSKHTDARFSHSICPDCARKHYPDLYMKATEGSDTIH